MKKLVIRLSVLLMLVTAFWFVGTGKSEVMAAENNAFITKALQGIPTVAPEAEQEGYIFAGYYAEEKCETPVNASNDTVYAKFVSSKNLSVKAQLSADATANSAKTNLRLVSSVDSLNYASVGFEIYYNGAKNPIVVKTSTVYERIVASATSGVDYNYSPKVVGTESEYFVTATLVNVKQSNFSKGFYVKPYWKTLDGTTVYGEGKYFTVNDGLNVGNINVTVKTSKKLASSLKAMVGATECNATVAYQDDTYAYLNIQVANRNALNSLSVVSVAGATTTYRNLVKEYNGTPDTSWYDVAATDEKKFVIATSTDLFGLAKIANEGAANGTKDNFAGKEIYVVADIAVNSETLITESMDANYTKWRSYANGEYTYKTAPTYSWTPISEFAGKFYGEGHTISGLYTLTTGGERVAFIQTMLSTAQLSDFSVVNSSFVRTTTANASAPLGSIVGGGSGTLDSIYSEALLDNTSGYTGGLIGNAEGNITMNNCWFNGSVTGRKKDDTRVGGLIGNVTGPNNAIRNCLNSGDVNGIAPGLKITSVGGVIGLIQSNGKANMENVLNTGRVYVSAGESSSIHALVGYLMSRAAATNVYSVELDGIALDDANKVTADSIIGEGAQTQLPAAFFEGGVWSTVKEHTPVLAFFKNTLVDYSWYDETKDTFVLYDKADLMGFAVLSRETDFAGKTVKLGADIEVIAGDAKSWGSQEARDEWMTIGNDDKPFAGTFDGGLHTISGIYLKTKIKGGLFGKTAPSATVRNLRLTNSCISSDYTGNIIQLGSIAGQAQGIFNNIYSDAIVVAASQRVGGLIGDASGDFTLMNAWFAGTVSTTKTGDARIGGLVGSVSAGKNNMIYNGLNTGEVHAEQGSPELIGGLVGHQYGSGALQLVNSLNAGKLVYSDTATSVDSICGSGNSKKNITVKNVYATSESFGGKSTSVGTTVIEAEITGLSAAQSKLTGFDFTNTWFASADTMPVLNFAKVSAGQDTSWYNVAQAEYVLYDKDDLYGFAELCKTMDFSEKTIKLGNDIVVNNGNAADWAKGIATPDYYWTPIGSSAKPFAGIFDGDMYSISGLYSEVNEATNGLFRFANGATVRNLKLVNSYFHTTGNMRCGSIMGHAINVTLNKVYSNAIVISNHQRVGGLLGDADAATLENCWYDGEVTGAKTDGNVALGGLIGRATSGTVSIKNCLNTGSVVARPTSAKAVYAGGFIGYIAGGTVELESSVNAGTVYGYNGATSMASISGGAANTATISVSAEHKVYATKESNSAKGVSNGNILHESRTKAIGENATSYLTGFDFEETWSTVINNVPVLKAFEGIMCDETWYDEAKDTFVLYDKADLYGFASLSQTNSFAGKTIKLGADIEVNKGTAADWETVGRGIYWLPIGSSAAKFAGTFDGQGYSIQGIYLKKTDRYAGLFGAVGDGAIVQNLKLENSYITSSGDDLGGIVGAASGTVLIERIYSNATVTGSSGRIGGLLGGAFGKTTLQNSWYDGTVTNTSTGNRYTGGIIGCLYDSNTATVQNCLMTGTVNAQAYTGTAAYAGGIVGATKVSTSLTIVNCLVNGKVLVNESSIPSNFGLLTGYLYTTTNTISNNYGVIPTEWTNAVKAKRYSKDTLTEVIVANITGNKAKETLLGFNFFTDWAVRENDVPVPVMETVTVDEYIVSTVNDLVTIAALSQTDNFAGKTIKLDNNIDLKDKNWTPISNQKNDKGDPTLPFAGTFDGQGYKISNFSMEASSNYAGIFAATTTDAAVKNLVVENANINGTARIVGIIAGHGRGTFSDIKVVNSTVTGGGRLGGLIGLAQGSVTMSNCSFDGTVTCTGNGSDYRYTGGFIGYITAGNIKMSNCLNAGDIYGSAECTSNNPGVGGLIGCVAGPNSIEINSCVNVGEIDAKSEDAIMGYGPIIGRLNVPDNGFEVYDLEKNYTVPCKDANTVAEVEVVEAATNETMSLLDWETQWEMVEGAVQVRFSKTGFVAGENLNVEVSALTNLTTLYSIDRVLKQGDIHAHANTDGDAASGVIDGTVDLATWKTQMPTLDMDFAASLDHQSTLHINNKDWDKDLFIYGSELGVEVRNSTKGDITTENGSVFGIHQNLYFTKEEDFRAVLTNNTFAKSFDYSPNYSNAQYYYGGNFKAGALETGKWRQFIETVQANNGFYVLAHPNLDPSYITVNNWETYLQPYLVDGMGLEVMYKGLGTGNVRDCYKLWKEVLNSGYKVYATAGTDTHADLETALPSSGVLEALTSFYTAKKSGENYMSEAYVRYLREGNFTAGSVGLQMSLGNTQMGGTGSFEDAYLEIGIGALHKSTYVEGHKYRVEIWSNEGIVHSQQFNATMDESQMTYLRMKADADSKYYRVEIYDSTTNTLLALGNPIWNE